MSDQPSMAEIKAARRDIEDRIDMFTTRLFEDVDDAIRRGDYTDAAASAAFEYLSDFTDAWADWLEDETR